MTVKDKLKKCAGKVNDFADKVSIKMHNWFFGTDAKPVPVFGYRARLYRWYLKTFRGYVDLHTSFWDGKNVEYNWEIKLVHKSKIPKDAVAITTLKRAYHYDIDNPKRGFSTEDDNGFTAVSAWLYMKCNKFEDAMRVNLDTASNIDFKKLITIVLIAAGIFLGLYYYTMQ